MCHFFASSFGLLWTRIKDQQIRTYGKPFVWNGKAAFIYEFKSRLRKIDKKRYIITTSYVVRGQFHTLIRITNSIRQRIGHGHGPVTQSNPEQCSTKYLITTSVVWLLLSLFFHFKFSVCLTQGPNSLPHNSHCLFHFRSPWDWPLQMLKHSPIHSFLRNN